MQRMSTGCVLLVVLCGALSGLLPQQVWAQNNSGPVHSPVHGLWVWKTSSVFTAPGSAEALRDFCRSEGVNEVYVSFSAPGGTSGRASEDSLLAGLIRVLHKSNIRVEALVSSADADEPGKPREKLLDHIREIVQFNQKRPKGRFDGIHLDIEPQQRPENKGAGNLRFLPGLIDAYRSASQFAESAQMTINADIPNKFLKGDLGERSRLLSSLPRFTLMLYELSSPSDEESIEQKTEKLRKASEKFLDMAYEGIPGPDSAKMTIALRTPDYGPLIPSMLRTLDDTLRSNPHYLGWAWHSYNDHLEAAH